MIRRMSPKSLALTLAVAGFFLFLLSSPAFAQNNNMWAKGCGGEEGLSAVFCSLSTEFRFVPRFLALISYTGGVLLFIFGLQQLRQYGDDPSQTPLRSVLIKFVLGAFLISLPLAMQVVVGTVTGAKSIEDNQAEFKRPCSAHRSAISGKTVSGCN